MTILFFINHFIQSYKIICLMGTKLTVLTTPTTALLAPSYSTVTTLKPSNYVMLHWKNTQSTWLGKMKGCPDSGKHWLNFTKVNPSNYLMLH
jgi:hypothetical protein